jgi:hypothetical protein
VRVCTLVRPDPKVATKWTFCDYVYVPYLADIKRAKPLVDTAGSCTHSLRLAPVWFLSIMCNEPVIEGVVYHSIQILPEVPF